jgi:hypothetical protein
VSLFDYNATEHMATVPINDRLPNHVIEKLRAAGATFREGEVTVIELIEDSAIQAFEDYLTGTHNGDTGVKSELPQNFEQVPAGQSAEPHLCPPE